MHYNHHASWLPCNWATCSTKWTMQALLKNRWKPPTTNVCTWASCDVASLPVIEKEILANIHVRGESQVHDRENRTWMQAKKLLCFTCLGFWPQQAYGDGSRESPTQLRSQSRYTWPRIDHHKPYATGTTNRSLLPTEASTNLPNDHIMETGRGIQT